MQNKYLKHLRKCLNIVTKTITTKRLHTYSLILAKSLGGRCYPRFPYEVCGEMGHQVSAVSHFLVYLAWVPR